LWKSFSGFVSFPHRFLSSREYYVPIDFYFTINYEGISQVLNDYSVSKCIKRYVYPNYVQHNADWRVYRLQSASHNGSGVLDSPLGQLNSRIAAAFLGGGLQVLSSHTLVVNLMASRPQIFNNAKVNRWMGFWHMAGWVYHRISTDNRCPFGECNRKLDEVGIP